MSGSNKRVSKNFEKWEENVESLGKSKKLTTLEFLKKFTTGHSCSFHSLERFSKSIKQAIIVNGRKADKKQMPSSSSNVISSLKNAIKEVKNWYSNNKNDNQRSIAANKLKSFFEACKKYESDLTKWCTNSDANLKCPAILDLVTDIYLRVADPMLNETDIVQIKQQSI